ncbi:hypothetical protein MASR2M8_12700 [Opitutaceae bacterium]
MDLTFAADPLASLRQLYRQAYLSSLAREPGAGPSPFQSAWREQLEQLAPVDATELEHMMAEERRRVDEARILAELLLPQLRSTTAWPRIAEEPARPAPSARAFPQSVGLASAADPSGGGTPAVADLLDAMLRQDSAHSKHNDNAA